MSEISRLATENPAPRRTGRLVRNVMSNWVTFAFSMGVNFFLAPFIVHHLGDSSYGVWTLMVSLTGYLGLLDLGVRGAVTRYIAKFYAQADHHRASQVASSALMIFSGGGILAILLSAAFAVVSPHSFKIPAQYLMAAQVVLVLAGMNVAVALVSGVFGGILVGLQRFVLSNVLEVAITGVRALTIVLALRAGKGLIALAIIQLAFTVARGVASIILAFRLYPELQIHVGRADREHVSLIFSFSIYSFLLHVSASVIYYTDTVVIGAFLPVGLITYFAISGNLVEYARALIKGISQTVTPMASALEARRDVLGLQTLLLLTCRSASMVALPIAITFMLRGQSFIRLWMGSQYAGLSGQVLSVLAVTLLFWSGNSPAASVVLGVSKHKPLVPMLVFEALCNLALSLAWVRTIGIPGVAWGTVVPNLASSLLFWPWYIKRTFNIPPLTYVTSTWIRPGLAILPFAACTYAIDRWCNAPNLLVFFLQVAAALPLACLGFWLLCLTGQQRQAYSRQFVESLSRILSRG